MDDPDTQALLQEWIQAQEETVEAAGRTDEAQLDFELRRAQLYFDEQTNREDLIELVRSRKPGVQWN